ncbi:Cof-type HAD-IIB family hydrolase [Niallia nealsonii]|uniref:Cof-type HAD-IIB family hydrolase n=1 Tax=Niallia nealsonii TaxID=115979 RepID=A0A2N0Z7K9_9BACI|nr:Cof-type HAD-IIB family hydrolase [Niallia nealsonii]PKG25505.1 Cof-type HAD-IIB family hydrolase [Niallia nealsonii]
MTKKHLIALDLDGTLLKNDKTISPLTKKVIQKARQAGHMVMIATGRPFRASEAIYRELNLDTPIVNFNGAFIHHPKDHQWGFYHTPLDIKTAKDIIEACHEFSFHNIIAEVMDDVYFHYHDEKLLDIFSLGNPKTTTGNLLTFLEAPPTCLLIHTEEEQGKTIRSHLTDVHADLIDHRRWADPFHVIEIVRTGLNKAVGLKRVSEYYQIPQENIIAFGDEDNDFEMIEYAGKGIAMGNGIKELQSLANETTLSNEEDGIAHYLNEALNLKAI